MAADAATGATLSDHRRHRAASFQSCGQSCLGCLSLLAGRVWTVVPIEPRSKTDAVLLDNTGSPVAALMLGKALFGSVSGLADIHRRLCCPAAALFTYGLAEFNLINAVFMLFATWGW